MTTRSRLACLSSNTSTLPHSAPIKAAKLVAFASLHKSRHPQSTAHLRFRRSCEMEAGVGLAASRLWRQGFGVTSNMMSLRTSISTSML